MRVTKNRTPVLLATFEHSFTGCPLKTLGFYKIILGSWCDTLIFQGSVTFFRDGQFIWDIILIVGSTSHCWRSLSYFSAMATSQKNALCVIWLIETRSVVTEQGNFWRDEYGIYGLIHLQTTLFANGLRVELPNKEHVNAKGVW